MKEVKTIAVDFDDTIAQFVKHLLELYNAEYNDNLTREDVTSWAITDFVKCGHDIWKFLDREDFFNEVEPVADAIEVLRDLSRDYEIFVVTSTGGFTTSILGKIRWLQRHAPFIDRNHWVFCGHKNIICADFMIDDGPHNLEVFNGGVPILFDAPHNRNEERFIRAASWRQVQDILEGWW